VAKAPSSLSDAASWVEKRFAKLRRSGVGDDGDGDAGEGRSGIQLRRFAGPRAYREQISHLRIAHLTDLHVGRITPLSVQQAAVDLANGERPDLVVLTGDFVCHSQLYLDQLVEVTRRYGAPTFAVLGNHDHWSGADEVEAALRRAGVEVLRNRNTTIEVAHQRLQIVGLDDAYTGHARPDEACKGLRADLPVLGLSHIAEEADGLWRRGVPLVLSGHTHGGQVTLARLHELSVGKLGGHKYVHGLYGSRGHHGGRRDGSGHAQDGGGAGAGAGTGGGGAVYVGAGIGAAVMPLRLGDRGRREVTIFELGAEPGSFAEHHAEQEPMPGRAPSQALMAKRAAKVVRKRLVRERRRRAS
jgi:predicted MPP superfamily phosphohydrolase